jgi:hypothetical protein
MTIFSIPIRFGRPQQVAAFLLLLFLLQCAWLLDRKSRAAENNRLDLEVVAHGLALWGKHVSDSPGALSPNPNGETSDPLPVENGDPNHSNLWYLIAAAPMFPWSGSFVASFSPRAIVLLNSMPSLFFGVMLGASLWYVSRRLYGDAGGYIALTLYCFCPTILRSTSLWLVLPEMSAAWGAFGAIFTAIAVSHTLYAPREVILWNWRRIVLLGLSFALALGSQFSLLVLVLVAIGFMLYLAPTRRGAALTIWLAAFSVACVVIFASYGLRPAGFYAGLRHAAFLPQSWSAFKISGAYEQVFSHLVNTGPALLVMLPIAIATYLAWPRTRFFGNTAPLLVGVLCLSLAIATPHYPGLGFQLIAIPFLFVFVAGVAADLLETKAGATLLPLFASILAAGALWNILELAAIRP